MSLSTTVALKEGSAVVEALSSGRQLLLLRKGGIRDPRGSFELEHREFLLYPTWEHQRSEHLRAEFQPLIKPEPAGAATQVEFRLYAGAAFTHELRESAALSRLEKYHIWTPEFVAERMRYKPQAPTLLVALRAYRLNQPVKHAVRPEYAGCKSWVRLAEPVDLGTAEPVVENRRFRAALEEICDKINSCPA